MEPTPCKPQSTHSARYTTLLEVHVKDLAATGRIFLILKSLTCTSSNVVYLAECVLCGLQGVGSTANLKSRLANYKSHIKHKRRTCSITNHFIDVHEADHSSLKFMLIDQHHSEVLLKE